MPLELILDILTRVTTETLSPHLLKGTNNRPVTDHVRQVHSGTKTEDHEEDGNKPRGSQRTHYCMAQTPKASQRGVAVSPQSQLPAFQLCLVFLHVLAKSLIEMTSKLKHLPTCLARGKINQN